LGTGYWAVQTQAAAIMAHETAELVGVWGRNPAKAQAVADRFGARAYAQVDQLLSEVDAVAIALPPDVQADLAVRAANAGRHLLLDKPLALSVDAADRLVTAVEANAVAALVFFTQRYYSNVDEFIREAQRGTWDSARITMYSSIFGANSPYKNSVWRREWGGLWDIGPHALSLVVPILGPVTGGSALSGPHDTSHVLLRHAGGAVSYLALTLDAPAPWGESVLYGNDGPVSFPAGDGTPVDAFGTAIDQLIALVKSGDREHPCGVRFARDVVAVLSAVNGGQTVA
jgi:predicted dehydrogenase